MIELFTPKRISLDCPFKGKQILVKISILTARCAFWLRSRKHTAELDSAVGNTPRSLTSGCDAHRWVFWESWYPWLPGMMHIAELDSVVGSTPRSSTLRWDAHCGVRLIRKCPFFRVFVLVTPFFQKTFEVKKIPWTIFDIQYQFNWLCGVQHTAESDYAVWCTQWEAHRRAF